MLEWKKHSIYLLSYHLHFIQCTCDCMKWDGAPDPLLQHTYIKEKLSWFM